MMVYVPTEVAQDWKRLLARAYHWKEGHSAMALAMCWEEYKAAGGPPEVLRMLPGLSFFMAVPEYKVDLPPKGGRPSQTDLFALGKRGGDLVAVSVEGKVDEAFGPTLEERQADPSPGVKERIRYLLDLLELPGNVPPTIRYQLLHRTAAAIKSALQFNSSQAVMLVHSFSQEPPQGKWFSDFAAFGRLFGRDCEPGTLEPIGTFEGVSVHIGWCRGDARFLKEPRGAGGQGIPD